MFILLLLSAYGKFIENNYKLTSPHYIGRFSGHDVSILASGRIDTEDSISVPVSIQIWVFSKQVVFDCNQAPQFLIGKIEVPITDEWGEDLKVTYDGSFQYFFYVSDCEKQVDPKYSVIVQLDLQDEHLEHYPIEYLYEQGVFTGFLFVHVLIVFLAIYGIYQEIHDEVSLVFIFVISIVYIVSIMFQFLDYWIYGMDGKSFKLILMFSRFFESFSRCSVFCLLMMVNSTSFDPKEFSVTGKEFFAYTVLVLFEFAVELLAIIYNDVSELFESFAGWGVPAILAGRVIMIGLQWWHSNGKSSRKSRWILYFFMLLPLVNYGTYCISPPTGKASLLYFLDNSIPVLIQFYLLNTFTSIPSSTVLPSKSHKY